MYSTDAGAAAAVLRGRESESWGVFLRNPGLQNSQQHRHTGCPQGHLYQEPPREHRARSWDLICIGKSSWQQCCGHTEGV